MKTVNIKITDNSYHPCEVECIKHDKIKDKYFIFYFDCVLNDYYWAELIKINDQYFVKNIDIQMHDDFIKEIVNRILPKVDVSVLPPFIGKIPSSKKSRVLILPKKYESIINKKDYMELESFEDIINGINYYYFLIERMNPIVNGFEYMCTLDEKSSRPLKKNIIARHKTNIPITDFNILDNGSLYMKFYINEDVSFNKTEYLLAKKIIEVTKSIKSDWDPVVLTKIVRLILSEKNPTEAIREYGSYINTYYDTWLREKNELILKLKKV